MARLVEHEADRPYTLTAADIDPDHGDIAVCRCGLSESFPFCDGSHRAAEDEDAGSTYRYLPGGEREVVRDVRTKGATDDATDDGEPERDEEQTGTVAETQGEEEPPAEASGTGRRLVTHEAATPSIVERADLAAADGSIRVCRCGLSADGPRCDGSHAACAGERSDAVYRYNGDGDGGLTRRVVESVEKGEE